MGEKLLQKNDELGSLSRQLDDAVADCQRLASMNEKAQIEVEELQADATRANEELVQLRQQSHLNETEQGSLLQELTLEVNRLRVDLRQLADELQEVRASESALQSTLDKKEADLG